MYPRKKALQLTKKKAGPTNNRDEALRDKEIGRDPQRKAGKGPRRDVRASETAWDHLSGSPPLTATISQVLREVQHEQFLRWPTQMRWDPTKRDNTKYCEFHRDYGHRTNDCIQLRKEIEYLIRRGYLRRFVSFEGQNQA